MRSGIARRSGGSGDHLLLLLHGLGATGAVWDRLLPLVEESWRGPWAVPDMRGHGRSPAEPPYGYAVHAADVAVPRAEGGGQRGSRLGRRPAEGGGGERGETRWFAGDLKQKPQRAVYRRGS